MDGVIVDPFGPFQSAPGRCHCGAKKGRGKRQVRVPRFRSSRYTSARSDTNFGNKGHSQLYGSRAAFDLKFLTEFAAGGVGTSDRRHEPLRRAKLREKSVRPPPSARLRIPW